MTTPFAFLPKLKTEEFEYRGFKYQLIPYVYNPEYGLIRYYIPIWHESIEEIQHSIDREGGTPGDKRVACWDAEHEIDVILCSDRFKKDEKNS